VSARLAVHLPAHQLPELQRAARCLLRTPLVTARDGDDFRLVRRWETVLRNEFGQKLGYRLDVRRSAARLLRRPATVSPHRGAVLESGRGLTRWAYVYVCLVLAAIEEPGHQILASELVTRIEQSVRGDDRLRVDLTVFAQRKAFRDAVRFLEQVGILAVRDGDVEDLVVDGQVLFDIDRDAAAMCMVASPSILREVSSVEDFVREPTPTSMEARRRAARQRLNRRMIDQPMVTPADLDPDEVELAWRNRRREADNISRLTGCSVELRREGLALIDHPIQPISGRSFPATDSVAHAALLYLDALISALDDGAGGEGVPAPGPDDPREVARRLDAEVAEACWARVGEEYGDRFAKAAREQPERFHADCRGLLEQFRMVGLDGREVAVSAFANRFRASPERVDPRPSRTSAIAREPGLFDVP
jgi:uncharacterized protein (TIGR02678 family)